jgi:hypothetical protein
VNETKSGIVSIIDMNGKELLNRELTDLKTDVDLSSFESGLYFVKLIDNDNIEFRKVLKL